MDLDPGCLIVDETVYTGPFADGDYTFFLPMARLIAAEREMKCSIFELFFNVGQNLATYNGEMLLAGPSPATTEQAQKLIRNGLIGGGVTETEARELVETYCYPVRPAINDLALARAIAGAAIHGVQVKKKDDAAAQ